MVEAAREAGQPNDLRAPLARRGEPRHSAGMSATLLLARHGRAEGMHAEAGLTREGEEAVRELARLLAADGLPPLSACVSPYLRARQTMQELLAALAPSLEPIVVAELVPDVETEVALRALREHGMGEGRMLVVSHMPLVASITRRLMGEEHGFRPGHLVEIALESDARRGRLRRAIAPPD